VIRIMAVVGARPQFVKAAVVSRALAATGCFAETLVHTGQHYDDAMSSVFFRELGLQEPALNLGVGSLPHGAQTGRMLEALEAAFVDAEPDWVLVYGDTNSTLAGALAAAKLHIAVAHVEAGLRSFNRRMPEELNRILTDHLAALLFAPTEVAVANLAREGIAGDAVALVGDVMYDATLLFAQRGGDAAGAAGLAREGYVLATIHRAENTDDPARLEAIVGGLCDVADSCPVVMPLHPRTRAVLERSRGLAAVAQRLRFLDPVGYLDMLALERDARLIVTDSGGVQKEAFYHRVRCVTLRDETEWVELVDAGWNQLVAPTSSRVVADAVRKALVASSPPEPPRGLYGGGDACERVAELLRHAPR
jgi:UDP-GlcNAc3NAcA epimerase